MEALGFRGLPDQADATRSPAAIRRIASRTDGDDAGAFWPRRQAPSRIVFRPLFEMPRKGGDRPWLEALAPAILVLAQPRNEPDFRHAEKPSMPRQ
jgi:hypothetical protein